MKKIEGPNPYKFSYQPHEFLKNLQKARKQGYWSMKWERKNRKKNK